MARDRTLPLSAPFGHKPSLKVGSWRRLADRPPESSRPPEEEPPGPPQWALVAALREACGERGVTLEHVAREAGRGGSVAGWERGARMLLRDIAALCAALGVRASALVARAESIAEGAGER